MYKIGDFSRLCRVSVKTLRYYDEIGLLEPDYIDKYTGYRYYEPIKLSSFNRITALKEIGFSLEEIKIYLKDEEENNIIELVEKKRAELTLELAQMQARLNKLDLLSNSLNQEESYMYDVIVKESDCFRLAAIRGLVKDRSEIRSKINLIKSYLDANNIKHNDISYAINYDTEYCTENLDVEVGIQICSELSKSDYVKERKIASCNCSASVVCGNSVEEIEKAYSSLFFFIENNHYQVVGAFCEHYHDNKTVEITVPVLKLLDSPSKEPRNDDIDVPFENDENVVGRWEVIDMLPTRDHFCKEKLKSVNKSWFKELYFLPEGEDYWCFGWTKGFVINTSGYPKTKTLNSYETFNFDGQNYMLVELKTNSYVCYGGNPEYLVLKQTDNKRYTKDEIRIKDNTDYPFVLDDRVIGKWLSVDLVNNIEDFNPRRNNFPTEALFFKYAHFRANGEYEVCYGERTYSSPHFSWTRDLTLAHKTHIAEKYLIKAIEGCEYLFIEWKSGDYFYGKRKPAYYVFRRDI